VTNLVSLARVRRPCPGARLNWRAKLLILNLSVFGISIALASAYMDFMAIASG
jgi:hypothetical protein